jgi:acetyl-CoA carboxylase biotin carboxyl carrier protein
MTLDEIRELIRAVVETGVAELEVQRGENRVRIRRSDVAPSHHVAAPLAPAPPAPAGYTPPPSRAAAAVPAAAPEPALDPSLVLVKAPIVGTFYESPSPGTPPFVKPGDAVEPGQVLCIIESMKLMNEIEAEVAGTIVGKLVENGHPVEYGEALFTVRPR